MCCSDSCKRTINTTFMVLAAILSVAGAVLIYFGGVTSVNINYDDAVQQGFSTDTMPLLPLSCVGQMKSTWSNSNSSAYVKYPKVVDQLLAACESKYAAPLFLYCFTGFLAAFSSCVAVYAAYKGTKLSVFGSALLLPFTSAMLVVVLFVAVSENAMLASTFVACKDYTLEEHTAMLNLGFICASGRTALDSTIGASSLFVAGTADLKAALQFLMSFVCLVAGTALSLLASILLIYTTHSGFYFAEAKLDEDQDMPISSYPGSGPNSYAMRNPLLASSTPFSDRT